MNPLAPVSATSINSSIGREKPANQPQMGHRCTQIRGSKNESLLSSSVSICVHLWLNALYLSSLASLRSSLFYASAHATSSLGSTGRRRYARSASRQYRTSATQISPKLSKCHRVNGSLNANTASSNWQLGDRNCMNPSVAIVSRRAAMANRINGTAVITPDSASSAYVPPASGLAPPTEKRATKNAAIGTSSAVSTNSPTSGPTGAV